MHVGQIWSFGSRDDQRQSNIVTCMLGKYDHLALEMTKGNVILWHVCWAKWYCEMYIDHKWFVTSAEVQWSEGKVKNISE
jgi:hypothetical protein